MSEELRPCPFCGGKNVLSTELQDGLPFIAYCQCGAENEAENWNTRPIEDALKARIAELEEKQRWIPVSERLPVDKKHYMTIVMDCLDGSRDVYRLRYRGDGNWLSWESEFQVITHWKEEPELPEVQE